MTVTDSWDMPLRTQLLARALRRSRRPERMETLDEIARSRAWFAPARAPYTWVTGPVPAGVQIGTTSFRARDGHEVGVRTYRPRAAGPGPLPALLWFHGGGWVLGNVRAYDPVCAWIAAHAGVVVLNVDYRLAPEHRAPQAAHDCVDAARWAASGAPAADGSRGTDGGAGIRTEGLGLAGDSAGGNLAAVAAHVLRDEGGADVGYTALCYPAVDATMSSASVREHANAPILTRLDMDTFLAHYLGDGADALDAMDPLVSPLHASDFAGLPATLVQTADLDPLRDEGEAYARLLREHGVTVRHTNYPRAPHGFLSFPGAANGGRAARAELADWVADHASGSLQTRPGEVG
ncbi:alpha/beta hydrolase [Terrabacter sp. NPDC000476]|uniref:alpha/beta hydrolase n=1 Tax=Terrabacter sp. NPDC000476 TaxID=3154258 RepID=UPI003317F506